MPSKTLREHSAMAAACKGNSTLGISSKVGCEFMHADKGKKFKGNGKKIDLRKKKA